MAERPIPTFTKYYEMWVERMKREHNPESRAMHYGYTPDLMKPLSADEAKKATNTLIAQQLGIAKNGRSILGDLGSGVGGTALYMADSFPNSHIVTINIHQPQLRLLRSFPDFPENRISTINADFMRLPLRTNSLDGAYAIDSSCYAEDKEAFYQEAMRGIKPGGRLVIFDVFNRREPQEEQEQALLQDSLSGWFVPNWHPKSPEGLFTEATFTDITPHLMPDIERSYQIALEKIQTTTDPLMRGHFEAIIALHKCLEAGIVQYGLLVATKPQT